MPTDAGKSTHDAAHWAEKTAEFDLSADDNLKNPGKFNKNHLERAKKGSTLSDGTQWMRSSCELVPVAETDCMG
jgi:hypothetical protein